MVLDDIQFVPSILDNKKSVLMFFPVTMFTFGVIAIEVWDTQFPVWAFVLALLIRAFCPALFLLAPNNSFCFSDVLYGPHRCDSGHHEPASWAQRHHGVDHRICPSWPSDCDDDVQDMGLYHHGAGASIHE